MDIQRKAPYNQVSVHDYPWPYLPVRVWTVPTERTRFTLLKTQQATDWSIVCSGNIILGDLHSSPLSKSWKVIQLRVRSRKPSSKKTDNPDKLQHRPSVIRSKVEGSIRDLNNRFALLNLKYRHSIKTQHEILMIACAILIMSSARTLVHKGFVGTSYFLAVPEH